MYTFIQNLYMFSRDLLSFANLPCLESNLFFETQASNRNLKQS